MVELATSAIGYVIITCLTWKLPNPRNSTKICFRLYGIYLAPVVYLPIVTDVFKFQIRFFGFFFFQISFKQIFEIFEVVGTAVFSRSRDYPPPYSANYFFSHYVQLRAMARTKQTARKATGAPAPRMALAKPMAVMSSRAAVAPSTLEFSAKFGTNPVCDARKKTAHHHSEAVRFQISGKASSKWQTRVL